MRKIFLTTNLILLLCLMTTAVSAQQIIRVKHNALGDNNGTSWANAFTTLQAAIDAAATITSDPDALTPQIWVAGGPYLPTIAPTPTNVPTNPVAGDRDKTFYITNRVELYGGFAGTNESETLAGRTLKTTLSGDLNNSGVGDAGDSYHVMIINSAGAVVLDGFTFTAGFANITATTHPSYGGVTINRSHGGGLMVNGASNNLTVKNCMFTGNTAGESAGVRVQNGGTVAFSDCLFSGNTGTAAGAAIFLSGGASLVTVTIDRTRFINNQSTSATSTAATGAIYVNGGSTAGVTLNINNSLFYGNKNISTGGGAGAIRLANLVRIRISGTTFYGNEIAGSSTANAGAAGIHFLTPVNGSEFKLYNSIMYGNVVGNGTNKPDIDGAAFPAIFEVKNTITQVYTTSDNTANKIQLGVNPLFLSTNLADGTFLQLQPTSSARQQGDVALANGTLDLAGNPRTQGGVDLGAYQSATTLPVEFESFDAKKVAGGAQLTWKVLSEANNEKFVVERSVDGQNFSVIASVVSKGNTNQAATYSYLDNAPLNGKNYYRLSQVDRDAVSNVLSIKVLDFEISASGIQVYPNPSTDVVRIKAGALQNSNAKVSLYSLAGAELLAKQISKSEAEQGFDLDIRSFNTGTYILVVDKGNVTQKTKIIITK